jgi:hypothetical protein
MEAIQHDEPRDDERYAGAKDVKIHTHLMRRGLAAARSFATRLTSLLHPTVVRRLLHVGGLHEDSPTLNDERTPLVGSLAPVPLGWEQSHCILPCILPHFHQTI